MIVLGIESSCDETAAAVVELRDRNGKPAKIGDGNKIDPVCVLHSNVVATSMDLHAVYGGVVPEIAARSHIEAIMPVINEALAQAKRTWDDIDAIAVTYGAGLGGSLLIGVLSARTLAITKGKPLYAINHVEGHVYANFIAEVNGDNPLLEVIGSQLPKKTPEFPVLALIVSGGHSQIALFRNHFDYTLLGQTQDDAIGEAFDKVAKIIGLPYPGGPSVENKAKEGDPHAFDFPKAKLAGKYDFSFSGLKTAVLRASQAAVGADFTLPSRELPERLTDAQKADIAASFVRVANETVVDKLLLAFEEFKPKSVVIAGGVAASTPLREHLAERLPIGIDYTAFKLCTDNGAMIATLGCFTALHGRPQADPYTLDIAPNLSM